MDAELPRIVERNPGSESLPNRSAIAAMSGGAGGGPAMAMGPPGKVRWGR